MGDTVRGGGEERQGIERSNGRTRKPEKFHVLRTKNVEPGSRAELVKCQCGLYWWRTEHVNYCMYCGSDGYGTRKELQENETSPRLQARAYQKPEVPVVQERTENERRSPVTVQTVEAYHQGACST